MSRASGSSIPTYPCCTAAPLDLSLRMQPRLLPLRLQPRLLPLRLRPSLLLALLRRLRLLSLAFGRPGLALPCQSNLKLPLLAVALALALAPVLRLSGSRRLLPCSPRHRRRPRLPWLPRLMGR